MMVMSISLRHTELGDSAINEAINGGRMGMLKLAKNMNSQCSAKKYYKKDLDFF